MNTGITVVALIYAANGGTRHIQYLSTEQGLYLSELFFVLQAVAIVAIGTGKLAIGSLLLRLLGRVSKWRRYGIWFLMILISIVSVVAVIMSFAQCHNPEALWNPALRPTTHCWSPDVQSGFSVFFGGLSAAIEFIFALLPITLIWKLHLDLRKKIGLALLLGGGVLSGICTAIRTVQVAALTAQSDLSWETFELYMWSSAEVSLIIICGSVPTIKPLWDRFVSRKSQTRSESNQSRSHTSQNRRWTAMFKAPQRNVFELSSVSYSLDTITRTGGASAFSSSTHGSQPEDPKDVSPGGHIPDIEDAIQITREFHVDWTDRT